MDFGRLDFCRFLKLGSPEAEGDEGDELSESMTGQ